jgi:hypothetical protein
MANALLVNYAILIIFLYEFIKFYNDVVTELTVYKALKIKTSLL